MKMKRASFSFLLLCIFFTAQINAQEDDKWSLDLEFGVNANMRLSYTLKNRDQHSPLPQAPARPTIRPQLALNLTRYLGEKWSFNTGVLTKTLGYRTIPGQFSSTNISQDFFLVGVSFGSQYNIKPKWTCGGKLNLYHYFFNIYHNNAGTRRIDPEVFQHNQWFYTFDLNTFYALTAQLDLGIHYEFLLNGVQPSIYSSSDGRTFYKLQSVGFILKYKLTRF